MKKITPKNISGSGFAELYRANGANNMRHFTFVLYHGAAGVMILKFADHGEDIITIDSTLRGEELKAEIKADSAAYGINKKLKKLFGSTTNTENWRKHKGNIKIMWDTKFCN